METGTQENEFIFARKEVNKVNKQRNKLEMMTELFVLTSSDEGLSE